MRNLGVLIVLLTLYSDVVGQTISLDGAKATNEGISEWLAFKNFQNEATPSSLVRGVGGFRIPGQDNYAAVVNTAPAQKFVPSVGGTISSVSAFVQLDNASGDEPLIVELRESDSGLPSELLGSVVLPQDRFSSSFPVDKSTFDLRSQNISIYAGKPYFVVFRTQQPGVSNTIYLTRTFEPNPLSLGATPIFSGTGGTAPWLEDSFHPQEIGLEIRIVPEPATWTLILGPVLFVFRRCGRTKLSYQNRIGFIDPCSFSPPAKFSGYIVRRYLRLPRPSSEDYHGDALSMSIEIRVARSNLKK